MGDKLDQAMPSCCWRQRHPCQRAEPGAQTGRTPAPGWLTPVHRPGLRRGIARAHHAVRPSPRALRRAASRRTTAPTSPATAGAMLHHPNRCIPPGAAGAALHPALNAGAGFAAVRAGERRLATQSEVAAAGRGRHLGRQRQERATKGIAVEPGWACASPRTTAAARGTRLQSSATGLPAWKRGQPGRVGASSPTVVTSAGVRLSPSPVSHLTHFRGWPAAAAGGWWSCRPPRHGILQVAQARCTGRPALGHGTARQLQPAAATAHHRLVGAAGHGTQQVVVVVGLAWWTAACGGSGAAGVRSPSGAPRRAPTASMSAPARHGTPPYIVNAHSSAPSGFARRNRLHRTADLLQLVGKWWAAISRPGSKQQGNRVDDLGVVTETSRNAWAMRPARCAAMTSARRACAAVSDNGPGQGAGQGPRDITPSTPTWRWRAITVSTGPICCRWPARHAPARCSLPAAAQKTRPGLPAPAASSLVRS